MKDVLAGLLVGAVGGLMGMVFMRSFVTTRVGKWFAALANPPVKATTTVIRINPDHFPNFFRTGK